jgi:hypothetical protein
MASHLKRLAVGSIAFGAGTCLTTWFLMRDGNLKVSFRLCNFHAMQSIMHIDSIKIPKFKK